MANSNTVEDSEIKTKATLDSVDHANPARMTIADFPAELLLHIFQFCYEDFKEGEESLSRLSEPPWHYISSGLDPSSMRPTSPSDLLERFRSPTRFPFALAAVSTSWNNLLSLRPEYWTEFIFFIGPVSNPCFEISEVSRRLKSYPRDMPIDFIVLTEISPAETSNLETRDAPDEEQSQMNIIKGHLFDHFLQCRSLSIETSAWVSFPDIGEWQYGPESDEGDILTSMLLTRRRSGVQFQGKTTTTVDEISEYAINESEENHYGYEGLKSFVIIGSHLVTFLEDLPEDEKYALEQIVIMDYSFSAGRILLKDLLAIIFDGYNLPRLTRLKLQNVEFGPLPRSFKFICYSITHLHLESISPSMMTELFKQCLFVFLLSIHLTKCPFVPSLEPLSQADSLILDDPDVDRLVPNLRYWAGSRLWLGRYRGSGDEFLDMVAKLHSTSWSTDLGCPKLSTLYLYRITNLSLGSLKKLIRNRNRRKDYSNPNWKTNGMWREPMIQKLSIDQCSIAPLTNEDIEWFSSRLVEFIYIQ